MLRPLWDKRIGEIPSLNYLDHLREETCVEPEKVISSESVFQGEILNVHVDEVRLSSGRVVSREVVQHGDAVVAVPIDPKGNVVLVRQYRHAIGENLLEAPAGGLEEAETADETVQRELQEETGYFSRDLRALGGFWLAPGYSTEYMHVYAAGDLVPSSLESDPDEDIRVEKVPMSRVQDMIRRGEIQDAKTVAALLMVVHLLGPD